jgi:hypothetical protein
MTASVMRDRGLTICESLIGLLAMVLAGPVRDGLRVTHAASLPLRGARIAEVPGAGP